MSDRAVQREQLVIDAPVADCLAVALDIERYSEWAPEIKEVDIRARDDEGRPELVAFRVAAMGHSTNYTLAYDYSQAPGRLAWNLLEGDVTAKLDGYYQFDAVEGDASKTDVVYELTVELVFPLPAFVKRRAEVKIMHTALRDLKARVESLRGTAAP